MAGFDVSQEFTSALGADISSDEIVDGTIVNADINSSAGIDISKLNQADIVTESEGIASNDTDSKIATCASIIDYVTGAVALDLSDINENVKIRSDHSINWSNSTANTTTVDVGLERGASGRLEVTDGSTGLGGLDVSFLRWNSANGILDSNGVLIPTTSKFAWTGLNLIRVATGELGIIDPSNTAHAQLSFYNSSGAKTTSFLGQYADGLQLRNAAGTDYAWLYARSFNDGSEKYALNTGSGLDLASDRSVFWSSTTAQSGSKDLGIERDSAGVLKVTDGSTGTGDLICNDLTINTALTGVLRADSGVITVDSSVLTTSSTLNDLANTSLADPGADQIVFWDDSDGQYEFISTLTGLTITNNTLAVDYSNSSSVNTGNATDEAITPDALAGSNFGLVEFSVQLSDGSSAIATGDGKGQVRVDGKLNGMNLVGVAVATTAPSTSGTIDVQVARGRQASAGSAHSFVDMLSTKSTIDANEYDSKDATTASVINGANDDVATGDIIRIDLDSVGTAPTAVVLVTLQFQLP